MPYILIALLLIATIIAYKLQRPQSMPQNHHTRVREQDEGHINYRSGDIQIDQALLSSEKNELLQESNIRHNRELGRLSKEGRQMIVILLSFAYGAFVFICLMHMGSLGMKDFIVTLWNLAPLAIFAFIPERFAASKSFTVIHSVLFLSMITFLTFMAHDLTYVHIDALNAIAFITMPILTFVVVGVFYGLSSLISCLKC